MTPEEILNKLYSRWAHISGKSAIPIELGHYILDNKQFRVWSASPRPEVHHYGDGGLITHTNEVIDLMFAVKQTLNLQADDSLIFLSALYHDFGKLWDYEKVEKDEYHFWQSSPHKTLIHHISRSNVEWVRQAEKYRIDTQSVDAVSHAILAHHGYKEWGSPVTPQTELAWLLHTADLTSARLNDWNKKC